jgi:hypothetical protein
VPSFKSWFLITLIDGADSRACLEASAAAAIAEGLIALGSPIAKGQAASQLMAECWVAGSLGRRPTPAL